jgi:hypothetical protein
MADLVGGLAEDVLVFLVAGCPSPEKLLKI